MASERRHRCLHKE